MAPPHRNIYIGKPPFQKPNGSCQKYMEEYKSRNMGRIEILKPYECNRMRVIVIVVVNLRLGLIGRSYLQSGH
jgi:hypothetical protein